MAERRGRIFVLGNRRAGIVIVFTNPVRTVIIERDEIQAYADRQNLSFDEAFGAFAGSLAMLVLENDDSSVPSAVQEVPEAVGHQVARGMTISDAEFCFISEVVIGDSIGKRSSYPPIQGALDEIDKMPGLRDLIQNDDPPSEAPKHSPEAGSSKEDGSQAGKK